jgi:hypothetical protein
VQIAPAEAKNELQLARERLHLKTLGPGKPIGTPAR